MAKYGGHSLGRPGKLSIWLKPKRVLLTSWPQVSSMFVVIGQDSVAHMAEEVGNASTVVPQAMVVSFLFNMPFTFVLLIT